MSQFIINLDRFKYLSQNWEDLRENNHEDYREFLKYGALLYCHLVYDRREQYLKLFQDYTTQQISLGEFVSLFLDLYKKNNRDSDLFLETLVRTPLSFFECHPKGEELNNFLELVFYECDSFSDPDSYHTEETFRTYLQKTLMDMEKLLSE